jgi:DNA-binding Lrp family transcriptional regulator
MQGAQQEFTALSRMRSGTPQLPPRLRSMVNVDPIDARILLALDQQPQATVVALAAELGLARNTVHSRLRRLHDNGALGVHSRRLDLAALGYPLLAFVTLSISQHEGGRAAAELARIPEVIELLSTTGEGDLLARVAARDTDDLHRLTNAILDVPGVVRTNTSIVLKQLQPLTVSPLLRRHSRSETALEAERRTRSDRDGG